MYANPNLVYYRLLSVHAASLSSQLIVAVTRGTDVVGCVAKPQTQLAVFTTLILGFVDC